MNGDLCGIADVQSYNFHREPRSTQQFTLHPVALERTIALVKAGLAQGDCQVTNAFGKHEAEGRGFRAVIAEAKSSGLPVLVGLRTPNTPAIETFCEGCAERVAPDRAALINRLTGACKRSGGAKAATLAG